MLARKGYASPSSSQWQMRRNLDEVYEAREAYETKVKLGSTVFDSDQSDFMI